MPADAPTTTDEPGLGAGTQAEVDATDQDGDPGGQSHENKPRRLRDLGLLAGLAMAVVVLDQASKWIVVQRLPLGASWPEESVLGLFSLTHVANTGVAFGLFQGRSDAFIFLAAMIVIGLITYHHRLPGHADRIRVALGLQIGGALGNLIDRVRIDHVTDFIKVGIWPVFNVADSAVVVGVLLLSWELWQEERAAKRAGSGGAGHGAAGRADARAESPDAGT